MIKQEDIIKPLIFLDIFDYPPTAMELWRFLGVQVELGEVINSFSLNNLVIPNGAERREESVVGEDNYPAVNPITKDEVIGRRIETDPSRHARDDKADESGIVTEKNGLYFLPGRESLIEKRREFFQLSEKKIKIAKRAAWLLHFIPSIKMIAVCNNFYYRPQSDIDFFIITAPHRLWLTRFFATIILEIFCLRARGKKTADKVCLSFYLSEDNLNLESVLLKKSDSNGQLRNSLIKADPSLIARDDKMEGNDKEINSPLLGGVAEGWGVLIDDPYFSYWLAFLEPIYGQDCYERFWQANAWIKNIFPNILPKEPVSRRQVGKISPQSAARDRNEAKYTLPAFARAQAPLPRRGLFVGDWLEKIVRKIQWWKISPRVKEMVALGDTRVVINDAMLKFHENDRREFFREELIKRESFNDRKEEQKMLKY
jgi:hypothetical protein